MQMTRKISPGETKRKAGERGESTILFSFILIGLLIVGPVSAGETFIWSEPSLAATITGSNEFYPGNNYQIEVLIENKAEDTEEILSPYPQIVPVPPSTALGTDTTLLPGDSPAEIKSGTYMVGDIPKGESVTVEFTIYIPEETAAGKYNLLLVTNSDYLSYGYMATESEIRYDYGNSVNKINLPITVKGKIIPSVISIDFENLDSGKQGYIDITFKNTGYSKGRNAGAMLTLSPSSPVSIEDGSVFIGDIAPGQTKTARFKVQVSSNVDSGDYPAEFLIEYTDEYGNPALSDEVTVGISPGSGPKFTVESGEISVSPGETRKIQVTYKNTGDATAYDASARITAKTPFTAISDSAILGEIAPGQTKTAEYTLSLDRGAIIKPYGLSSEVKYYDELDNLCLSDELKVEISAVDKLDIVTAVTNPVVVAVILALVLFGIYYIYRKENMENEDS